MNTINDKLIEAIINKANQVCPGSLALIGIYGSFATGDVHTKSDLDLLVLINDEKGFCLADCFILDDVDIGYDIYCTSWEMLENDGECNHAHLSKLLDSPIIYVNDDTAVSRIEALREKARNVLLSEGRFSKARACFDNARQMFAECFLTDSIAQIRTNAGAVIYFLMDSVMLANGGYFRKGVKRTFEELKMLSLPFDMESMVMEIIRSETPDDVRAKLTRLMRCVHEYLPRQAKKEAPCKANVCGTYEEMFSNWRNKMIEAVENDDLFSSYMNMASCQFMVQDIMEHVQMDNLNFMNGFDPHDTEKNRRVFDEALNKYLEVYKKAGIHPRRFADVDEFIADYLKKK